MSEDKQSILGTIDNLPNSVVKDVLNRLSEAVVIIDHAGIIQSVNPSTCKMFGYSVTELGGVNVNVLMPKNLAEKHDSYIRNYQLTGDAQIIGKGRELTAERKDGHQFPIELMISDVVDNDGQPVYVGVIRDISERFEYAKHIKSLAFIDPMTRLGNANAYYHEFDSILLKSRLVHENISIHLVTFHRFFRINHVHGHQFGNNVIKYISKLLNKLNIPAQYNVYRINGVKFLIVFSHAIDAEDMYQYVLNALNGIQDMDHSLEGKKFMLKPRSVAYTFSAKHNTDSSEKLLRVLELCRADRVDHSESMLINNEYLENVARKTKIESLIRVALERGDEFYVVYQPQFSAEQQCESAEALLRWNSPEMGEVFPDEFIPIAERTGLIIELTEWLIAQVGQALEAVNQFNPEFVIAINISPNHINLHSFATDVANIMEQHSIAPRQLMLEITERSVLQDTDVVLSNMEMLNKLGTTFSIDDFGTGHSSLSSLSALPFHELKVDRSFVKRVDLDAGVRDFLASIIAIAKVKHVKVVVEGVEDEAQIEAIQHLDIDLYQGYFFSRPVVLRLLKEVLSKNASPLKA